MAQASLSCPHCHSSISADEVVKSRKCLTCGAQIDLPADVSEEPTVRPDDKTPLSNTDSQTADVGGRNMSLAFLSPPEKPDEIGRLGPYRVLGQLGAGGMGIVLKAEDTNLRRMVALKVLRPEYAAEPSAKARFVREARAAAAVEHDHIVPIFQIDEARGTAYLAMPLLRGESLSTTLKRGVLLSLPESVRIGKEIAEGLAAAHAAGMIHRDIKPGNVWLEGSRQRVRILDFGLARVTAESSVGEQSITREGAVIGTPAYMSPEQARGLKVDGRSDLFSLGVVLYQMVTGHLPFRGANSTNVLMAIVMEQPRPPAALNHAIPVALNDLIMALLNKDPNTRPATADLVARMLADIGIGMSVVPLAEAAESTTDAGLAIFSDLDTDSPPVAPKRAAHQPRPKRDRNGVPPVLLLSVAGAMIVLTGAAILLWQAFGSPSRGTLVIESDDPNAEVVIRRGGEVVQERTRLREIRLRAGDYTVELADRRGGLRLEGGRVTLGRGGRETVWIKLPPKPPPPPPPPDPDKGKKKTPPTGDSVPAAPTAFNGPTPPSGALPPYRSPVAPLPAWVLPKGAPAPAVHPFSTTEAKQHQDAWAKYFTQPITVENKLGMTFTLIPPGEFDFPFTGSGQAHAAADTPTLRVRLTRPYYLGATEVTIGQFEAFVKETGYKTEAESSGEGGNTPEKTPDPNATWRKPWVYEKVDPRHPVVQVSCYDAMAFCDWLSKKDGVKYRLPTEAEWRFAARAGSKLKFGPASTVEDFRYHEWTADDPVPGGQPPYRPVGVKRANPFGLYDMLGNVHEWVYDATPPELARSYRQVDPIGPLQVASAMGGNFSIAAAEISPEWRWHGTSRSQRFHQTGFRIVREAIPAAVPADPTVRVRAGQPLASRTVVTKPQPIPGVQSWTVEPSAPISAVVSVAWSSAGNRIATAHLEDTAVRLWDRSGNMVSILHGHEGAVSTVAFSKDGKRLASWGENIRIWDVETGKTLIVLPGYSHTANRLAFSPDGSKLLCAGLVWTGVFDVATGRRIGPIGKSFAHADWSPDGKHLLVASNVAGEHPAIWKIDPLEKVADLKVIENKKERAPETCWAVAWSPDGKWVAAGRTSSPAEVHIWDAKTFEFKALVPTTGGLTLSWHPDSRRIAIPGSGIWEAFDTKQIADLTHNQMQFAWSPDGTEGISGSQFKAPATGQSLQSLSTRGLASAGPLSLSPDGKRLIDTTARPGKLRDAETGEVITPLPELIPGCQTTWSPSGDRLAVWGSGPVRIVDAESGGLKLELKDSANVRRLTWAPNGKHLATAIDRDITVWDAVSGTPVRQIIKHSHAVAGLVWSPDGSRLASAGVDVSLRVWDPITGDLLLAATELPEPGTNFQDGTPLAWSPDGQTLWVIRNAQVYPLDVRTGNYGPAEPLYVQSTNLSLTAAPDGKLLTKDASDAVVVRAGDPGGKLVLGAGIGPNVLPFWLSDSRRFFASTGRGHAGFDTFTRSRLGTLFPAVGVGGEYSLVVGPTGHYRGGSGVESHIVYVAMLDDGSQRTYTPSEFASKFGWKNDPNQATFLKLDAEASKIAAPPFEGYWPRLNALRPKGGQFFRADGVEVKSAADLQTGAVLGKIVFAAPTGTPPLGDSDVDSLRNLPAVDGTLRLEGAGVTDAALARLLGFSVFERVTTLEIVNTPAGDATLAAAAALPMLTQLDMSGTQITATGLTALKAAKKLASLDLRRTKVTAAAVKALATALPNCRIEWDESKIEGGKK